RKWGGARARAPRAPRPRREEPTASRHPTSALRGGVNRTGLPQGCSVGVLAGQAVAVEEAELESVTSESFALAVVVDARRVDVVLAERSLVHKLLGVLGLLGEHLDDRSARSPERHGIELRLGDGVRPLLGVQLLDGLLDGAGDGDDSRDASAEAEDEDGQKPPRLLRPSRPLVPPPGPAYRTNGTAASADWARELTRD